MDMQSSLQTNYIGSSYKLLEVYLYKDDSGADFYVDVVYIGKMATTMDTNGKWLRSNPFRLDSPPHPFVYNDSIKELLTVRCSVFLQLFSSREGLHLLRAPAVLSTRSSSPKP